MAPADPSGMDKASRPETVEEKLDVIIQHLHRLDRRDRIRTYGAMLHSVLAIIPMIFFVWSAWYVYAHGDELLAKIASQAASQAASYSTGSMDALYKQFQDYLPGQQQDEDFKVR